MNNENGFDIIIAVVFAMSNQLGGLGTKAEDLVFYFRVGEVETLPKFHIRSLQTRSANFLLQDKLGQNNNLTGKFTMELSKLKKSPKIHDYF